MTADGVPAAGADEPAVAVRRAGERALLVELAGTAEVAALYGWLREQREAGVLGEVEELVPAARTVLLDGVADVDAVARLLRTARPTAARTARGELLEVPTVYDGADLAEVAALWGVSEEAAVRIHTEPEYTVAFCGFSPGFGYLTGLPARYEVPRRATPRSSVPAGSVALAGSYTGVYPHPSPGGWQLVGRTALPLWDTDRDPPALLAPGVRVRFTSARA
ncbi:KipI family sensor histidine kinase inhibitor [Streptomyces sp. 1114.5]|uniref:5-oxoprolinase subunit PxpB n=1 Tax=Streptomyces sp. 1114.5 TaxID=1938830 RepID=UPI000F1C7CB3|nr:5-oxoprolinase subunit PxpB [Streptomyces sp. 1114.5]RKT11952.1 KipI family sensor histidine kinase inhibitor [Streptomyces sp. 1114.5]